jgi:hypothetical protein
VAQAEGGLPRVHAGAEELELEDGLDLADIGGDEALHAETALADAGVEVAVVAELLRERGQLDGRTTSNQFGSFCLAW